MSSEIDYEQSITVLNMHRAPRFGHSSSIASLASTNKSEQNDYVRGLVAFSVFLFVLFLVWGAVLATLKFMGSEKVGCAAGGNITDISKLRKEKRSQLRSIVRRSWRVQTVFFFAGLILAAASGLYLRYGVFQLTDSLHEVQEINHEIEAVVYRAIDITDALARERTKLNNSTMLEYLNIDQYCKNPNVSLASALGLPNIFEIRQSLDDMSQFLNNHVTRAQSGLQSVGSVSRSLDEIIEGWFANDWLSKLFVLVLNVINAFLFVGLCLSRNNVVYPAFRRVLAYVLVPAFIIVLVVGAIGTCVFGVAALMNADFCSGGASPGSPHGTIKDVLMKYQSVSEDDIFYQSFVYYLNSCTTSNPLEFVQAYESKLRSSIDLANSFIAAIGNYGLKAASQECGEDVAPVVTSLVLLSNSLDTTRRNLDGFVDIMSCSTVSPILRRIFYGPICTESVDGLTWIYSTTLVISVMGLTMLSVRAALYNATVRRHKKPSRRAAQREWDDYKEYMAQYYGDADDWTRGPTKTTREDLQADSFETEVTAKPSIDLDDNDAQVHVMPVVRENSVAADSDLYVTPRPAHRLGTQLDGIEFSYRTRDMLDVLDTEIEPLSPVPAPTNPPGAPRKHVVSLRRTNQGKLC